MKVVISKDIYEVYSRVVKSSSQDALQSFATLPLYKKNALMAETLERGFRTFWNRNANRSVFKRSTVKTDEPENVFHVQKSFRIRSCSKEDQFYAELEFQFDDITRKLEVLIQNETAAKRKIKKSYMNHLRLELIQIKKMMESEYTIEMFLSDFFYTLCAHKVCMVTPDACHSFYTIYKNANEYYPMFNKLSYEQKVKLLKDAYYHGDHYWHKHPSIDNYAMNTFKVIDKAGLIKEVEGFENGTKMVYKEVRERREDRRDPFNHSDIWERDCLIYATYEYTIGNGTTFRISFHPSDLWGLLARQRNYLHFI